MIEFTWKREDFIRGFRHAARPKVSAVMPAVAAPLLALSLDNHVFTVLLLVASLFVYAFWIVGLLILAPRKNWHDWQGYREPRRIAFSDEGIDFRSESLSIKNEWKGASRSWEDATYYFLRSPKATVASFYPKSAFASATDEAAFRALLRRRTIASLKPDSQLDATSIIDNQKSGGDRDVLAGVKRRLRFSFRETAAIAFWVAFLVFAFVTWATVGPQPKLETSLPTFNPHTPSCRTSQINVTFTAPVLDVDVRGDENHGNSPWSIIEIPHPVRATVGH